MKVVEANFEEIKTSSLYKKIELAGRTCYKSENNITDTSAIDFTKRIMSYNHGSVLEHARLVLEILNEELYLKIKALNLNFITLTNISKPIISFNFRTFYNLFLNKENYPILNSLFAFISEKYNEVLPLLKDDFHDYKLLDFADVLNLTNIEKDKHLFISIRLICDRGVSHELVRHRLASFSQESTRYCNYSKDKFLHEITFIKPLNLTEEQTQIWFEAMQEAEKSYFKLIDNQAKPEQARSVLPNSLKTEVVTTCSLEEWKLIFDLRCSSKAHPDIRYLMQKVQAYFKERGYL